MQLSGAKSRILCNTVMMMINGNENGTSDSNLKIVSITLNYTAIVLSVG